MEDYRVQKVNNSCLRRNKHASHFYVIYLYVNHFLSICNGVEHQYHCAKVDPSQWTFDDKEAKDKFKKWVNVNQLKSLKLDTVTMDR